MKRFLLSAAVAAVGLALLTVTQAGAAGPSSKGSGRPSGGFSHTGSMRGFHGGFNHGFKPNGRFGYGRHGFRSLSWTHYRWNSYYHRYFYWAPSYGWCFYEPTYGYYLPLSFYREVYPEAVTPEIAPLSPAPSVVQQTTVVNTPAPVVGPAAPPVAEPPLPPAPAAVQQTHVGHGGP